MNPKSLLICPIFLIMMSACAAIAHPRNELVLRLSLVSILMFANFFSRLSCVRTFDAEEAAVALGDHESSEPEVRSEKRENGITGFT